MERSAWPKNLSSSGKQAIKELLDGQNPTKKIRHLFDAHSQTGNNTAQPSIAEDLIVNVLRSSSNTLSPSSSATESYEVLQVPSNACVRSEVSEGSESIHPAVPRTLTAEGDQKPASKRNGDAKGTEAAAMDGSSWTSVGMIMNRMIREEIMKFMGTMCTQQGLSPKAHQPESSSTTKDP